MMRPILFSILILLSCGLHASRILIPMDETQKNHLKSYGLAFWVLQQEGREVNWLLNYKGGSFMIAHTPQTESECKIRGISYDVITESEANSIEATISNPEVNMNVVKLLTAPK
ncbi:MAG: hypothetical protein ACK5CL_10110, partial [Sphingomonadales bacterium]